VVRESLDRNNSAKFGEEFAHLLDSLVYTLRIQADQDVKGEMLQSLKNMSTHDKKKKVSAQDFQAAAERKADGKPEPEFTEGDIPYNFLSLREVRNIVQLLNLYINVNQ
jgi:hypothetical protein